MPRKPVGIIRKAGKKPKAYVDVIIDGVPRQKAKRFPVGTLDAVLETWRAKTKAKYKPVALAAGTFAADVEAYLALPEVQALVEYGEIVRILGLWIAVLGGDRPRAGIEQAEFEAVIQDWLTRFAEPTVYHRRSVLLALFKKLDGETAANNLRGTTCPRSWLPKKQGVAFARLRRIVDAMQAFYRVGQGIIQPSKARLVTEVLLHTGVRPIDLLRVRRSHVDWTTQTVAMSASKKGNRGRGAPSWTLHLTDDAVLALRAFDAATLYGAFNIQTVSHAFKHAVRRVEGPDSPIHLYALRHSVGTDMYRKCGDLATVGRLLGHVPGSRMTEQYALDAHADVDRAAVKALGASRAATVHARDTTLPTSLPATTKRHKRKHLRKAS